MKDFRKLQVWEKAHTITLEVYRITTHFPKSEQYGLIDQIRRSASSVPANIAEGCGRGSDSEFARFLQIAMGSASELEYHLLLSRDLKMIDPEVHAKIESELVQVKKMLATLITKIRSDR